MAIRLGDRWILHGGDAVPFNVAVDDAPDWISRLFIGPHVPRIRTFMKTHPEVQVVGAPSGEENQRKGIGQAKAMTKRARTGVQQAPTKG